jgi:hypothetical protein
MHQRRHIVVVVHSWLCIRFRLVQFACK